MSGCGLPSGPGGLVSSAPRHAPLPLLLRPARGPGIRPPSSLRQRHAQRATAMAALQPAKPGAATILVIAGADTPELSVLARLPPGAR
jgi:hypothetical protein